MKLLNWLMYRRWTTCRHDWWPEGFADFYCRECGAQR